MINNSVILRNHPSHHQYPFYVRYMIYFHKFVLFLLKVGKFMKCKWHGESDQEDFSGHRSDRQNTSPSGFTTVSHSCQIFVTGIS